MNGCSSRSELEKQKEKVDGDLARSEAKLANADFVKRAPPEVVEQFERTRKDLHDQSEKYSRLIAGLGPA